MCTFQIRQLLFLIIKEKKIHTFREKIVFFRENGQVISICPTEPDRLNILILLLP